MHNVVLMSNFCSALMLARHVSDITGPSSGAFCTSCIRRLWYVAIGVLLYKSSRYNFVGPHCVSCWTTYILQDDTRSLQCQLFYKLLAYIMEQS